MKYAIVKVTDGNYNIHTEHDSVTAAKVEFHNLCRNLWNASDVTVACVMITDENLDTVERYKEFIDKRPAVQPTPEPSEE